MAGQRPAQSNFPYDSLGLGPVNMNINKPKLDAAIGDYASFIKNMKSILSVEMDEGWRPLAVKITKILEEELAELAGEFLQSRSQSDEQEELNV